MAQYRFVGGAYAAILDTPYQFKVYGQLVEMSDELAMRAAEGGVNIIPANMFTDSPETVKKYAQFEKHRTAPPEFHAKKQEYWDLAADFRQNPKLIVEAAAAQPKPETEGGK